MATRRQSSKVIWIRSGWLRGSDWNTALTRRDLRIESEERWISLGPVDERMHIVVWTPRGPYTRIISMRKANDRRSPYMRRQKVDILITDAGDRIIMPTAEESKAIDEQIASDPNDFELDDAWFESAKPTQELFPEALRAGGATEGGPECQPHPARDRHPGPGDGRLVQGPDGGGWGDQRDAVAGAGRTDPPGPCPGPRCPEAPFAAFGGLIPPRATSRRMPVGISSSPGQNPLKPRKGRHRARRESTPRPDQPDT